MITPQYFELSKVVEKPVFNEYRNAVRDKKTYDYETDTHFKLAKNGIIVKYHKTETKNQIKLYINPSMLLGNTDLFAQWKTSKSNIEKMLHDLDDHIIDYFNYEYKVNDFKVSRFTLVSNILLDSQETSAAYIKILQSIRKVKGFTPKYKNDLLLDEHRFDLVGNTNGIEFSAYDVESVFEQDDNSIIKSKRSKTVYDEGALCLTVKLTSQKAINDYTDETQTVDRIIHLTEHSDDIFLDTLTRIVPFGDYYKKERAIKTIEATINDGRLRSKMLYLLELIPKKKSLYLALKEMSDRHIDEVFDAFVDLNISPVTISKRQNIKHLKSLYSYL